MSDRVPILPRFAPTHVGTDAGFIPVSEIFDLKRLGKLIGTPVLEWDMLKNYTRENVEDLGCWGTHPTLFKGGVLRTTTENRLGLGACFRQYLCGLYLMALAIDISYTAVPTWAHINHDMNLIKVNFIALVALSYPKTRAEAIEKPPYPPFPARSSGNILPPDQQLECFDYTYDRECSISFALDWLITSSRSPVGMHEAYEWTYEWSPAWKKVGRYMYFAPWLEEVTHGMVKRALGIPDADELPLVRSLYFDTLIFPHELFNFISLSLFTSDELTSEWRVMPRTGLTMSALLPLLRTHGVSSKCGVSCGSRKVSR